MVKAVAAAKGIKLGEHRNIIEFVQELSKDHPELNLTDALPKARYLHTNFYEDELPHDVIGAYADAVKEAIGKLNDLL